MFLLKTAKFLGATTLAGALLFTGAGATYSSEANAAEQGLSDSQVLNTANGYIQSHGITLNPQSKVLIEKQEPSPNGYVAVMFGEQGHNGPSAIFVNKSNGSIIDDHAKEHNVKTPAQSMDDQNQQQDKNATNHTNNSTSQNNNQGQSSQATSNAKTENKTQSQNQSKALPETGEETSNTTLVTMIASVILAAGSLLAFRRTSKSNK